jgi:hypothetical protein
MTMRILSLLLLCSHLLVAQRLSHPLHAEAPRNVQRTAAVTFPDTLHILAIMVQFQTDTDPRTSGNGQFDLTATNERIIDPPPHDSAYVADHFRFVNNYFAKSSNNKQFVAATVLGTVITLKKQMKEYAPIGSNLPLATMIDEAWKAADSLNPGFPFERYEMFAVFHAGVGKDIDLRAALGYDPTPLDLPSLYFSTDALRSAFGSSFTGITLKNSPFKIPNTVVLPETEVRRIPGVGGDVVLKLGINGLLAASIGSHLGLPDLFDTKTGKTAIGRFGLMDGQSIFSFYGMAPPEPSAWEKIRLGWTTPIELSASAAITLPAAGLRSSGNDTIYKVPISAKEYYLIENRHRDVNSNGNIVTVKWKGAEVPLTFLMDTTFYSNSGIDSVYGTVVDVEEFDWSLPGLVNTNNKYYGGVLIWHIDETVIERNIAANTVNADDTRRGVDLEEADGSQDIGKSYSFGDPASGTEDGSPIDYWFEGNIFPNYSNTFSETTLPNSLSNTFAHSHITIGNFSRQSPRMTANVVIGSPMATLKKLIKRRSSAPGNADAPLAADLNSDGTPELIYTSGDSLYALKADLTPFLNNTTGLLSPFGGSVRPVLAKGVFQYLTTPNGITTSLVGATDSIIYFFGTADGNNDGLLDTIATANAHAMISTPLMSGESNGSISFGTVTGMTGKAGVSSALPGYTVMSSFASTPLVTQTAALGNLGSATSPLFIAQDRVGDIPFTGKRIVAAAAGNFTPNALNENGQYAVAVFASGQFAVINAQTKTVEQHALSGVSPALALANIDGDRSLDILLGAGDRLIAFNVRGNILERFPIRTLDGGSIIGAPVVAAQKNSSSLAIIYGTTNGHLYAVDERGTMMPGFPLQTSGIASSPVLFGRYLAVATTDSGISIWETGLQFDTAKVYWNGHTGNQWNSSFASITNAGAQKSSELLPKKFAYNWPNPVYSGSTNIRYFLGKAATVSIKIVNMAGELVQELKGTGFAGLDNEVPWDITNVQSGIYFAQITASGSGEETSQIVKIAVVK